MAVRLSPRVRNTFISLFIATALIVPLAVWQMPNVIRWQLIGNLDSPDIATREKALNFLIRRGDEPAVRRGAIKVLTHVADETNFIQIASALQRSGHWSAKAIPLDPWLRWVAILATDATPTSRIQAAQLLANLEDHPKVRSILKPLLNDADAEVRYNALIAAAELRIADLVTPRTTDDDPWIAREAWLFVGLLDIDLEPDDAAPPLVAEAMQWALTGKLPQSQTIDMSSLELIESLPVGEHDVEITGDMTDTFIIAATAVTTQPNAEALYGTFDSPYPFIRDRAAITAAKRFDEQTNRALIRRGLDDFDDNAKRTAAILAGLTGLEGDYLAKKERDEDVWAVRQVHRLGLWMMGREPAMDRSVEGLLTRDDLPATTILLAMLKADRRAALNIILSPRTDEPTFSGETLGVEADDESLLRLLVHYRWWPVLAHFLPDAAPRVTLWATPDVRQLELDILRDWWLVNRGRGNGEHL